MAPHQRRQLGVAWRLVLGAIGILLLAIGLAGLALPGIQGILTLVLALACLSLTSPQAHRLLRWSFQRWPKGWRLFLRGRRRLERFLGIAPSSTRATDDHPSSQEDDGA